MATVGGGATFESGRFVADVGYRYRRIFSGTTGSRCSRYRIGRGLSHGERGDTLTSLSDEIKAIDAELRVQHQSCLDMQRSIGHMQALLTALREAAARTQPGRAEADGSEGSPHAE